MNYKKLGNTDIDVSTICLGTMTWGEQNTQEEGFEQMNYALEKGVNFWDENSLIKFIASFIVLSVFEPKLNISETAFSYVLAFKIPSITSSI